MKIERTINTNKTVFLLFTLLLTMLWSFSGCELIDGGKEEEHNEQSPLDALYEKTILNIRDAQSIFYMSSPKHPDSGGPWKVSATGTMEKLGFAWELKETGELDTALEGGYYLTWRSTRIAGLSENYMLIDGNYRLTTRLESEDLGKIGDAMIVDKHTGDIYPVKNTFHPDTDFGTSLIKPWEQSIIPINDKNELIAYNTRAGFVKLDYSNLNDIEVTQILPMKNLFNFHYGMDGTIYVQKFNSEFVVFQPSGELVEFEKCWFWMGSNGECYINSGGVIQKIYKLNKSDGQIDTVKVVEISPQLQLEHLEYFLSWSKKFFSIVKDESVLLLNVDGSIGVEYLEAKDTVEFFDLPPDFHENEAFVLFDNYLFFGGSGNTLYRFDPSDRSTIEFIPNSPYVILTLATDGSKLYFSGQRITDEVIVTGIVEENGDLKILDDQTGLVVRQVVPMN